MMDRTDRRTLAWLGGIALVSLVVVWWFGRAEPLVIAEAQAAAWDDALERARGVHINAAGVRELTRLPGIGPALAQRIVAYRDTYGPFATPADLQAVRGIGPATIARLEGLVQTTRRVSDGKSGSR